MTCCVGSTDGIAPLRDLRVVLQELRDYLNGNRRWLASLLAGSSSAASQDGQVQHTALLSSLVSTLLMCCDSEVRPLSAPILVMQCLSALSAGPVATNIIMNSLVTMPPGPEGSFRGARFCNCVVTECISA